MTSEATVTQSGRPLEFDVFISYSSVDARQGCGNSCFQLLRELKKALESHRHPADGKRFRACTFTEDFELAGSLPKAIQSAIDKSAGLVVLSGAGAAKSGYVALEVDYALSLRDEGFVLLAAQVDQDPSQIWPRAFSADDLGLDLTCPPTETVAAWRERVVLESHKLVARIWKLPLNEVHDRHATQARQFRQRLMLSIGMAVVVAASIGTTAVLTWMDGQRQEAARLGQSAQAAARVQCFDPRGLADGIKAITHIPVWRGGAPATASYGLHSILDRARRQLMVRCDSVRAAAFVDLDPKGMVVQCLNAERWRVSNDWPPVRTRLANRLASPEPYRGPSVSGEGWEVRAEPEKPIVIARQGEAPVTIPVTEQVWRLVADATGRRIAWIAEDDVLRVWDETRVPREVAWDVTHSAALLMTADGEAIVASVEQAGGTFNDAVQRWTRNDQTGDWQVSGVLHPYGGPIQSIAAARDRDLFSIATDHNGVHLWEGGYDVPVAHLSCPERALASTAISDDGETVAAGWIDVFATRWQRNATRGQVIATSVKSAAASSSAVIHVSDSAMNWVGRAERLVLVDPDSIPVLQGDTVAVAAGPLILVRDADTTHRLPIAGVPVGLHPARPVLFAREMDGEQAHLAAYDFAGVELWSMAGDPEHIVTAPNGAWLYVAETTQVRGLDALTGAQIWQWTAPEEIERLEIAHDGTALLVQSDFGGRTVLAAQSGAVRWQIDLPDETLINAAFLDADTLAVGNWDGRVDVYALPSVEPAWSIPISATGTSRLAVSPDAATIAVDAYGTVHLVDVGARALRARFELPGRWAEQLFFDKDGAVYALTTEEHLVRFHRDRDGLLEEACRLGLLYPSLAKEVAPDCASILEAGAEH